MPSFQQNFISIHQQKYPKYVNVSAEVRKYFYMVLSNMKPYKICTILHFIYKK